MLCSTAWSRELQPAAAAYFGELEKALIHGTSAGAGVDHGMIQSDAYTECKTAFSLHLLSFSFSKP
jgi:hypothetical protein